MKKIAATLAAFAAITSLAGTASAATPARPRHAEHAHAERQVAWGKIERVNTSRRAFEVNNRWYRYGAHQAANLQPGKSVRFSWRHDNGHRVAYRITPYSG